MAYKKLEGYGSTQYVVDTEHDKTQLPKNCEMGDMVLVIETGYVYVKNSSGEWVKL